MRRIYIFVLILIIMALAFTFGMRAGELYPPGALFGEPELEAPDPGIEETVDPGIQEPDVEKKPEPDLRSINMLVAGDITAHVPQIQQAHIGEGQYDFSPSFEIIGPYLKDANLAVGDLETSQAGPDITFWGYSGYTGYPMFNAPQEFSEALHDAGFNLFTMANNHSLDRGYEGLVESLSHVRSLGVKTFGAYKSWEERDNPLTVEEDGIKIAFIAYTYCTNGIPLPEGHEYCVNLTQDFNDIAPVIEDIKTAREQGADLVAVFPHWGNMYVSEPQPQRLRDAAAEMAAAGADLIMGAHPHFIQPLEWFFNEEEGSKRATLGAYSLGNFISNQHYPHNPSPFVEYGLLLDIELTKNMDSGEAWISGVDYEITWVHRDWRHRILPLSDVFAAPPEEYNLNHAKVDELKTWYQRNIEVVEMYGHSEDKKRALEISESFFRNARE